MPEATGAVTVTPMPNRDHGCITCRNRATWQVQPGPRRNVWRTCGVHLVFGIRQALASRQEYDAWT